MNLDVHELKTIAFFLSQTIALMNGKELYSKKALKDEFEEIGDVLYRCEKHPNAKLQKLLAQFLDLLKKAKIFQNATFVIVKGEHENCLCKFEKNSTRALCLIKEGSKYCKVNDKLIIDVSQPNWKINGKEKAKIKPCEECLVCFDKNGERI